MKKGWSIVLIIVVVCIAIGAVSAGVGVMTGADFERIGAALEARAADRYNVDLDAFLHEWIPQTIEIIRDAFIL